ncbi:hypothetical protein THIOKS12520003 [Thiocapsa sp. KS1]|nr:hypothetical protein THIOKS12520003 [Thiocapsa sp. KS1]
MSCGPVVSYRSGPAIWAAMLTPCSHFSTWLKLVVVLRRGPEVVKQCQLCLAQRRTRHLAKRVADRVAQGKDN